MASYFSKFKELLLKRKPVAHGYRHGPANMLGTFTLDKLPPFTLFTADTMLRDPQVKFGLTIRNGGLLQGEVEIKGDNQQEVAFVQRQWDRIWNSHAGLLLRAKRWGYAPFEVTFKPESGKFNKWVGVKDLHFFHPRDARLLVRGGEHAGIRVNRLRDVGQEKILMPSALWVTHQADTGNRYGMSINFDAYSPWWEKWMERGAKDVLRLRMIKDAYSGDVFKVPMELVEDKDGNQIPYMDLIREAIEARLAGSPLFLPNLTDENGNSLIEYTPPSDNGRPDGILEWAERLDWDIWKGQGVVREVVEAATSGSGYSGRSIPMTTFLTALGEELKEVVHCVDRDVLRPLTHINTGREPSYEIYPKSLVETFADDMGNSGMGGESMGGTQSQQRGSGGNGQWIPQQGVRGGQRWMNTQTQQVTYQPPAQFAEEADGAEDALRPFLITADRWIRKSIREIMDEIRESAGSNIARPSLLVEITAIISRLRQRVRRGLAESMVAAGLYGMHSVAMDVAEHMPPPPTGDTSVPPSSPPPPTEFPAPLDGDDEPEIRFPIVDKMLTDMRDSPVFNDTDYRAVAQQVHDGAFAVTGDLEAKTVEDIRNTLVENLERGPDAKRFVDDVQEVLINSDGLSENHLHTVFRTNMQTAVSDSMERALHKPLVVDFFQYRAYFATSDERTRDAHRALEKLGLNGTNIYNKDDPVWQEFRAPWDYNCRCSWAPVTVRDAANRGVVEAQEWWARAEAMADERGGRPANYLSETAPASFEFVPHPPFSAPPEFKRR